MIMMICCGRCGLWSQLETPVMLLEYIFFFFEAYKNISQVNKLTKFSRFYCCIMQCLLYKSNSLYFCLFQYNLKI